MICSNCIARVDNFCSTVYKFPQTYSYCTAHLPHVCTPGAKLFLWETIGVPGAKWRNFWAPWNPLWIVNFAACPRGALTALPRTGVVLRSDIKCFSSFRTRETLHHHYGCEESDTDRETLQRRFSIIPVGILEGHETQYRIHMSHIPWRLRRKRRWK